VYIYIAHYHHKSLMRSMRCVSTIRYDTIGEINVDSKAEYTA